MSTLGARPSFSWSSSSLTVSRLAGLITLAVGMQSILTPGLAVDGEVISSIGRGLMVLIGIGVDDTPSDSAHIIKKLLAIRLFEGPSATRSLGDDPASESGDTGSGRKGETGGQMWKSSVMDIGGEILCVSQFTLMARTEKGSKPDFHQAMGTSAGKTFYETFLTDLGKAYAPERIKDGRFGAMMQVSLTNDGPITITLDSKNPKNVAPQVGGGQTTPEASASGKGKKKENKKDKDIGGRAVEAKPMGEEGQSSLDTGAD